MYDPDRFIDWEYCDTCGWGGPEGEARNDRCPRCLSDLYEEEEQEEAPERRGGLISGAKV